MYQVPWPATLPYGPVMWAPLVLPALAHADIRLATLVGFLFVPCLCLFAAADRWAQRRRIASIAWLAAAGVARAQPRHAALRLDRPHPGVLAAAGAAGVARRRRTLGRRRAGHRPADRRANDDGVDGAGADDRRVVSRSSAIRADRESARGRVRAAVSAVRDLGLVRARVRSLRQLSGGDQRLRLDLDRLGAAHDRDHRHAAVARLGPRGGDRAGGHDGRRLRRLRGGCSRRTPPAALVRVRAARLQHDDAMAGVVHLPGRLPAAACAAAAAEIPWAATSGPAARLDGGARAGDRHRRLAGLVRHPAERRRSTPAPTPPAPSSIPAFRATSARAMSRSPGSTAAAPKC